MAEVRDMTSTDETIRAEALSFLARAGAKCVNQPHSLKCTAPVSAVEALLSTRVHAFKQTTRGGKIVHRVHPDEAFTFPSELLGKVSFFTNLADFPTVRRRNGRVHGFEKTASAEKVVAKLRGIKAQANEAMVAMETVQTFYNTAGVAGATTSIQAPAEFQDDASYNKADLKLMATQSGLTPWTVAKTIGPYDGTNPDLEASLDEQYIGGVGQGNTNWYWTEQDWMVRELLEPCRAGPSPLR